MENNTEIFYLTSNFYNPVAEAGIRWNDKFFNLKWPSTPEIISERDSSFVDFTEKDYLDI